jgi:hypothetical protein
MELVLLILGLLMVITGALGSFLPVIPGPPLSYAGLWLMHFSAPENRMSVWAIVIFTVLVLIISILDYLIPAWGTKKFGGTKWGMWGSTIGLLIGLFFGPAGIIIGPFLGALVGELLNKQSTDTALKSAIGSFVGFILGSGLKLLLCLSMLVYYLAHSWNAFGRIIQSA